MILEYVEPGILYDIIEHFSGVGEIIAKYFMNQLTNSLEYLEKQNVAHLDLKLENILVDEDMNIKIADFGFASYQDSKLHCYGGTQSYMAPEILEMKSFDGQKADIFALGVIMFVTVMGVFPFQAAK